MRFPYRLVVFKLLSRQYSNCMATAIRNTRMTTAIRNTRKPLFLENVCFAFNIMGVLEKEISSLSRNLLE